MYCFDSRVRYSEVNHNKLLDFSSIINYFQDCSTFHSEDIGQGLEYLEKKHRVWVLNSWQIVVNRYPSLGERIQIGTLPYDYKSMYGYRNFLMQDENGVILAIANSVWVLMDTIKMRPLKITENDMLGFQIEEKLKMDYAPRKIALSNCFFNTDCMDSGLLEPDSFPVIKANIDTNNHVNNGQYIKMAEEFLPTNFVVKQMRAEYRMSAVLGDIIVPQIKLTDSTCTVVLSNIEKKPYVVIEFIAK